MKRLFIEAGDIQRIQNISERQARNILAKLKHYYKKEKHQKITVREYSQYCGVTYEEVCSYIL